MIFDFWDVAFNVLSIGFIVAIIVMVLYYIIHL